MHDQFQLRLEHHHLLAVTKAECGHPSELEVTRPVVSERLLMAQSDSSRIRAFDDKAEFQIVNLEALKRTLTIKNTHPLTHVSFSARPDVKSLRF